MYNSVILSEVAFREAKGNAVEGPHTYGNLEAAMQGVLS